MSFLFPRSHLAGLILSSGGGSSSFGVAAGQCLDSNNLTIINQSAALTKTTGAWLAGTAAGALDTGSIAINTWYHAHKIYRDDTQADDVAISLSPTAPTLGDHIPIAFSQSRRLGAMKTDGSGNWKGFIQDYDRFRWLTAIMDVNDSPASTSVILRTLSVPTGIVTEAMFSVFIQGGETPGNFEGRVKVYPTNCAEPPNPNAGMFYGAAGSSCGNIANFIMRADTSAQINTKQSGASANVNIRIDTYGWIDRLGRDK